MSKTTGRDYTPFNSLKAHTNTQNIKNTQHHWTWLYLGFLFIILFVTLTRKALIPWRTIPTLTLFKILYLSFIWCLYLWLLQQHQCSSSKQLPLYRVLQKLCLIRRYYTHLSQMTKIYWIKNLWPNYIAINNGWFTRKKSSLDR